MTDSDFESLIQRIGRDPSARIVHENVVQCSQQTVEAVATRVHRAWRTNTQRHL